MHISALPSAYPAFLPSAPSAPRPVESASSPELARSAFAPVAASDASGEPKDASAGQDGPAASPGDSNTQRTAQQEQTLQLEIAELVNRDREVRTHEQAHAAVGGAHAGAPTYSYTQGPDGKRYITGGEVSIDVGAVANDPQATLSKMEIVKRAALAPAEPSAQDRRVAAQAQATMVEARGELAQQQRSEQQNDKTVRAEQDAEKSDDPSVTPSPSPDAPSAAALSLYSAVSAASNSAGSLDLRA